jgi:uncharacterized protein YcaQ
MPSETISIATARSLMLNAQGLARLPDRPATKPDLLATIRRMKMLQIDSINIIARSPYLVLWSRLGDYDCDWLDELLVEGAIFEYWSHAMCFLPIEDYPLYRRVMFDGIRGWRGVEPWLNEHAELVAQVLERIQREGGQRAADFEGGPRPPGAFWHWKEAKTALESLFITGELMIARRQSFQRVYDLRSRVLPGWDDGPGAANVPSAEERLRALALRTVEALGVTHAGWAADYFRLYKASLIPHLEALADEGRLRRVALEGLPGPAYRHPAADIADEPSLTTVLSPFDPLVWDRQRLRQLFGFDYTIEVYTPSAKRRFGYFTLPILHRGALVGRLDPKAHREAGRFEVRAIALEPGVEPTDDLVAGLADALRRLAAWHGTPELTIGRSEPAGLAAMLLG